MATESDTQNRKSDDDDVMAVDTSDVSKSESSPQQDSEEGKGTEGVVNSNHKDPATHSAKTVESESSPADDVDMLDTSMVDEDELLQAEVALSQSTAPKSPSKSVKVEQAEDVKLLELFDDDDLDDDGNGGHGSKDAGFTTAIKFSDMSASDPEIMRSFYQRLFPWRPYFHWLNHSPIPSNDFAHREFAFMLSNDAVMRYQSYVTADLMRKDVLRLLPPRFDIGPVYSTNPRDRKSLRNAAAFKPVAKELCFDIDLTDYDDIRTCCQKAAICHRCWAFMKMAIPVIDGALRADFGFQHILWVYSGRRGIHAWVCDRSARTLDDAKRKAIAGYFEVLRGGAQSGKKVNLWRPLHPHITCSRSLDQLKSHFQEVILEDQDPWRTEEQAEKLLKLLPNKSLSEALRKKWELAPGRSSLTKWADIDQVAKTVKGLDTRVLLESKQDIVLEYTYPRLDIEVSKKLVHLLKSPFVVHPGTGRVCVPINTQSPEAIEAFDPFEVPTVQSLLAEIDEWKDDTPTGEEADTKSVPIKGLQDWEKTSLKPYVEYFRSFVSGLVRDETSQIKQEDTSASMDF